MNVFRIAVATLLLAAVGPAFGKGFPMVGQKHFYLASGSYAPEEVYEACADGYHFASYWELMDISSLIYDTNLGPPLFPPPQGEQAFGWMDTYGAEPNCENWTANFDCTIPDSNIHPCGEGEQECCPSEANPEPANPPYCCFPHDGMVGELRFFPPPEPPEGQPPEPWSGGWDIHPHPCVDPNAYPRVWCVSDPVSQ